MVKGHFEDTLIVAPSYLRFGSLAKVGQAQIQALIPVKIREPQSEVSVLGEALQGSLHKLLNDSLINFASIIYRWGVYRVLLIEIEHLKQVIEVIMRFVCEWLLREAQRAHILFKLFAI